MAEDKHKELSGAFSPAEKWRAVLACLRDQNCLVEQLQVLHNKEQHNILVAAALYFNASVKRVDWGDLDPVGACCLAKVLAHSKSLQSLKVQRVSNVDATVSELVPGLRSSHSLEELHISWAGQESLLVAAAAVRAPFSALSRLTITRSALHPDVAKCFGGAYALGSGNLLELNITDCTLMGNALQVLLTGLEAHSKVARIRIDSCGVTAVQVAALLDCPTLCQRLKHLSLANNNIGNAGVKHLAQAFKEGCSLGVLDLEKTGIDDRSAQDLATITQNCQELKSLLLPENELADMSLESLAPVVSGHASMTELDLTNNKIGGPKCLGSFVGPASPLKRLSLCKNWRIGDEGAVNIAAQLELNSRLETLQLSECGIKCDGAKALAVAVKVHPALVRLHLDGCRISDSGALELLNAVRSNLNMRCWNMDNNRIRDKMNKKMVADFAAAVSRRTDESVLQRKSLQLQHAAHQPLPPILTRTSQTLSTPQSPHHPDGTRSPQTPGTPANTNPTTAGNANSSMPKSRDSGTPQGKNSFTMAGSFMWRRSAPTPQDDVELSTSPRASSVTDAFPSILNLWKNMAAPLTASGSSDESPPETSAVSESPPRSLFQGLGPAMKKMDSFGRWISGSQKLASVDSLQNWSSYVPGLRSRTASVLVTQPESEGDTHEDEAEPEGMSFAAAPEEDAYEEAESPRFIGAFGSFTRAMAKVSSFRFNDYTRSSSESNGTPSFSALGVKSPIGSPTVSPPKSAAKPSRLREVSEQVSG